MMARIAVIPLNSERVPYLDNVILAGIVATGLKEF
jgi:hypothetical protein